MQCSQSCIGEVRCDIHTAESLCSLKILKKKSSESSAAVLEIPKIGGNFGIASRSEELVQFLAVIGRQIKPAIAFRYDPCFACPIMH